MAPKTQQPNRAKNLERRHMVSNHGRTTIALEPEFWIATDKQAKAKGMNWRQWVIDQLDGRPDSYGRAGWLRVAILKAETLR
jgi:predicted DNA-binding ribbon-helix-helix protein